MLKTLLKYLKGPHAYVLSTLHRRTRELAAELTGDRDGSSANSHLANITSIQDGGSGLMYRSILKDTLTLYSEWINHAQDKVKDKVYTQRKAKGKAGILHRLYAARLLSVCPGSTQSQIDPDPLRSMLSETLAVYLVFPRNDVFRLVRTQWT